MPPVLPRQFAASRTRIKTSSSATTAASLAFGSTGARSLVTKETSASGSTASGLFGSSAAAGAAVPVSASMRWALKGGIFAERSLVVIDRLPEMRMNGRTRITSRLPTRVTVETRTTLRAAVDSPGGAAKTSQDSAAKPLYGDTAAVDHRGLGAIDGKRRLVTEINDPGLASVA